MRTSPNTRSRTHALAATVTQDRVLVGREALLNLTAAIAGSVRKWQGRRESNSQPLVLETSALPIELHPCMNSCHRDPGYLITFVTTPDPTVRPPSRMAKRTPSSMAIGLCNSICTRTLSPGMHISASTRLAVPVTSVVRK